MVARSNHLIFHLARHYYIREDLHPRSVSMPGRSRKGYPSSPTADTRHFSYFTLTTLSTTSPPFLETISHHLPRKFLKLGIILVSLLWTPTNKSAYFIFINAKNFIMYINYAIYQWFIICYTKEIYQHQKVTGLIKVDGCLIAIGGIQ